MVGDWLKNNPEHEFLPDLSFEDLGISGWKGKHASTGGLSRLLAAAEEGKLDGFIVLVEAVDRLSRQAPLDALDLFRRILTHGVTIITLEDSQTYSTDTVTNDPSKLIVLASKVSQANQYSQNLSRRIKGSYESRRKKAAAGEQVRVRLPWWFNGDGDLDPRKSRVLVELFEEYVSGKGERQLYRLLEKRLGRDCPYADPSGIKRALKNRKAIGEWDGHKCLPQAIPDELWYAAQNAITDRRPAKVTQSRTWPLSGIVYCGECDVPMTIKPHATAPNMMCQTRARKGTDACEHKSTYGHTVLDWLRAAHELDALTRNAKEKGNTDRAADLVVLRGRRSDTAEAMQNLVKVLESGYVEAMAKRAQELQAELDALDSQVAAMEAESNWVPTLDPNDLNDAANEMELVDKCRMLQLAGLRITIYKDQTIEVEGHRYQYAKYDRKRKGYPLVSLTTGIEELIHKG